MKGEIEKAFKTILVADDDEVIRVFIKNELEKCEYKVIEASDGVDAIEKFMKHKDKVQLIIVDLIMPKMPGKEAYETIKIMKPDIRAIFISGYDAEFIYKKVKLEEGSELILKPHLPRVLLRKVREILGK